MVNAVFAQVKMLHPLAVSQSPVVKSFTPQSTGMSAWVTIRGTGFTNAASVSFGSSQATSFVVISDNTIAATVGTGSSGAVSVTTAGGKSSADGFTFVAAPVISYETPKVYFVNKIITPLLPQNTGGAVPATVYGQVTTFAGSGTAGFSDGTGKAASFYIPVGIVTDDAGNLYVGDSGNASIRKITPGGVVTTFAGGLRGYHDGTVATAQFGNTFGLAFDKDDNLYVCDELAGYVRKITPTGVVTTIAGNGQMGFSNGTGTAAGFNVITGDVVDEAGNIFVADQFNNLIRKVTPAGVVSTFAGSGNQGNADGSAPSASFNYPFGITNDPLGNLYVADRLNNLIRKITPAGIVGTFAGNGFNGLADGTATAASFNQPEGIAIDPYGDLYIADAGNGSIRMVTSTGEVSTIAGSGAKKSAEGVGKSASFFFPIGISLNAIGEAYITESSGNIISKVVLTGYTIDKPLPSGLLFDATTGKISGTPTAPSPSTDYKITAYNIGGKSGTIVNITVLDSQTITFGPLTSKTVCDADFDPGATTRTPPITYNSDNRAVAIIMNGKVHITGAGTSVITASDGTSEITQTLTVAAAVTPTISISLGTVDCIGINLTYQSTITNGGTTPSYQWQVNGINAGENAPSFTGNFKNNDKITCTLTSDAACTTQATVISNEIIASVVTPLISAVSITSSENNPVCAGTPITFTAIPVNPGNKPAYQWMVNGIAQGLNANTFTSSSLENGDIVTCILSTMITCQADQQVESNAITVSLNPTDQCVIVIPNTFTPNGDGINDLWTITALVNHPDCLVRVFSRYGQLVFRSRGYSKPWDGNTNNSPLPTGTYYYIIDLKNGASPLTGYVAIIH